MFISVPWACHGGEEGKGQYKQLHIGQYKGTTTKMQLGGQTTVVDRIFF